MAMRRRRRHQKQPARPHRHPRHDRRRLLPRDLSARRLFLVRGPRRDRHSRLRHRRPSPEQTAAVRSKGPERRQEAHDAGVGDVLL